MYIYKLNDTHIYTNYRFQQFQSLSSAQFYTKPLYELEIVDIPIHTLKFPAQNLTVLILSFTDF